METQWYVLYTAPRAEKVVEKRLKGEGYEVFLPLYKSKRKWSDRIKIVELPLFSSYIFVRCSEHKLRYLTIFPGVVRVVYYVGKPAIVKDYEIDAIKEFISLTADNEVINEGDMVSILKGPFEKKSGQVTRISGKFAYLHIQAINATVCVKINLDELKKGD